MTLPVYPTNDYERGAQLLRKLGSFWINVFTESGKLQKFLQGSAHEYAQTYLDTLEAIACLSRLDVPVFHAKEWYLLTLKKSESLAIPSVYAESDLVFGPQPGTNGRPVGFVQTFGGTDKPGITQARLPAGMVDASFTLQNAVTLPSRVFIEGLDYDVDKARKILRFRFDPFTDPLVPKRDVFDSVGKKTDEEIALWVYQGKFDLNYIYTQFGYALGLKLASSQGYKDVLNALWDMNVLGASVDLLQKFLQAVSGVPMIINAEETLELIRQEQDSYTIVTDSNVYHVPLNATLVISDSDIGKKLYAGDPLTDAVSIQELSCSDPDYTGIPSLSVSKSFLSGPYMSELSFKNHNVDLEYLGLDSDGKAIVRFETFGYPGDVEMFWDLVHAAGKAQNNTLANMLDQRTNKVGEPGPLALPSTVNPMQFVFQNLLRNNLFVIKVNQASFSPDAVGVRVFRHLRYVVPPHTTYIVFVNIPPIQESIDLTASGGEDEAGVEETVSRLMATGVSEEYQDITEIVSAKLVSLTCE